MYQKIDVSIRTIDESKVLHLFNSDSNYIKLRFYKLHICREIIKCDKKLQTIIIVLLSINKKSINLYLGDHKKKPKYILKVRCAYYIHKK